MEYRELLIDFRNESPAKAQRRKEQCHSEGVPEMRTARITATETLFFAPLRLCGILFLLIGFAYVCPAQPRRLMTPADVVRVATVTSAQFSPNGQFVVYTVSSVADDKTISTLWIARLLPEVAPVQPTAQPTPRGPSPRTVPYVDWPEIRLAPRALLPAGWSASSPRWSPDGNSIAFL